MGAVISIARGFELRLRKTPKASSGELGGLLRNHAVDQRGKDRTPVSFSCELQAVNVGLDAFVSPSRSCLECSLPADLCSCRTEALCLRS
jgi:hypothetical protein